MRNEPVRITDAVRVAAVAAAILATGGCRSAVSPIPALARAPHEVTYAASLGVSLEQMTMSSTGLYRQTLMEGTGTEAAVVGDVLDVHYTGWTHNGIRFDTSQGKDALRTTLGSGDLIPGFAEGLEGMRLNEVRLLVIPHELGYGSRRIGDIPPYAVLVFRVELVDLQKAPTA